VAGAKDEKGMGYFNMGF